MNPALLAPVTRALRLGLCGASVLLAACGGGGGGGDTPPPLCSLADQKLVLRDYMHEWYFWYRISPNPAPAGFTTVNDYFEALLYTGGDPAFPAADGWSTSEPTESFDRFFSDGQSLGYGLAVAGNEVTGQPDQPLLIRYVEPQGPAAAAGLARGDQLLTVNGRSSAEVITSDDYSALTADTSGQTLALRVRRAGVDRDLVLTAAVFNLTPVQSAAVVNSPLGRKLGYVLVKDMLSQANAPLDAAFAQFKSAGVQDLVLDLRYNGGGLISVATTLASYASAARAGVAGQPFATLLYNDKRAARNNETYRFANAAASLGLDRVYVLTGPRTCSASEQVINGLRGVGVEVVAIGDTTCGKPVGFLPADYCGTTYSAVNFESVNARTEGRYFDGFEATCPAPDDFSKPLGAPDEGLLAVARQHADSNACPAAGAQRESLKSLRKPGARRAEAGERQGMLPR